MAFGSKDKKGGKSGLERIAAMFNPEAKGTPSGGTDMAEIIEKTLAASVAAVMYGKKSGVEDYNALKSNFAKKSYLEQIMSFTQSNKDSVKNIYNSLKTLFEPVSDIRTNLLETATQLSVDTLNTLYSIDDTLHVSGDYLGEIKKLLSVESENINTYAELAIENSNIQTELLRYIKDGIMLSMGGDEKKNESIVKLLVVTEGSSTIEDFQKAIADIAGQDTENLAGMIENINKLNDIKLDKLPGITETINSFGDVNIDPLQGIIAKIAGLGPDMEKAEPQFEPLGKFFKSLASVTYIKDVSSKDVNKAIKLIKKNYDDIAEVVNNVANDKKLQNNLQIAKTTLDDIKTFYTDDISQLRDAVVDGQAKMGEIAEGAKKTAEQLEDTSSAIDGKSQVNIQASFEGLGKTIMLAGATMLLGGWILSKNPKLIVESLKFGAVLTVFIAMTMAPMLMLRTFSSESQDVGPILDAFGRFIMKATFIMLLGGLIFMIGGGKFVKASLKFGATFAAFVLMCTLALTPLADLDKVDMNGVANFVVKATLIMMLGALFIMFGGGKIVKNSLRFGIVLGLFIFLVLLPFKILGGLFGGAMKAADEVARLIVTATIIMMVGAMFLLLGGGKFAVLALTFGIVLGLFIFLVMLPFKLLFGKGGFKLALDIKIFQNFLITTTILLLVGALFMTLKGGEYAINALKFGGLLMLFTLGVLLPFIILKKPLKQAWGTIIAITALIIVEAVILMMGVQMVQQGLMWEAIGFTVLFAVFLLGTITPFILFQSAIDAAYPSVLAFAALIAVTGLTITLLTAMISEYGFMAVLGAAITLVTAVGLLTACFMILGELIGEMSMGLITAGAMSMIIGTIALSLVMLMLAQKQGNMLVAAIILVGVMGLMVGMFALLSLIGPYISIGLGTALGIGAVLLALSTSFFILGLTIHTFGDPLANFMILAGVIAAALVVFVALGNPFLAFFVILGSVTAIAMSAAFVALSIAFMMLHVCVAGNIVEQDLNTLMSVLETAGQTFEKLGEMIIGIVFGSVSAIAMSAAYVALSVAFLMLRLAIGDGQILEDLKTLNEVLNEAKGVFALLGLLFIPISLALISITAMTISLVMLSGALRVVGKLNEDYKDLPKTLEAVFTGPDASIAKLKEMFKGLASPFLLLKIIAARATMGAMAAAIEDIAWAYGAMGRAQKKIAEGFGSSDIKVIFKKITGILTAMPEAFMAVKDNESFKQITKGWTLYEIERANWMMSRVVSRTANVLGHMAHYTVLEIDKDGKWKTVVVKPEDMLNAAIAISKILTTLSKAVWDTSVSLKGIDFDDLEDFLDLNDELGDMVASMAAGIKDYAEMLIPVYRGGQVVKKRPMNEQDFTNASEGIAKVMTTVVGAVGKLAAEGITINGKHKDWEDVEDDLAVVIDTTSHIGDIISNIAEGIKNYAELKVPTGFNPDGSAIGYRKIKEKDFKLAANNTETVMTTMINALSRTYSRNSYMFEDAEEGFLCFKKKKENSSPIAKIIGIAVQIGELISNTAEGVSKMAAMQIADKWDDKGKPTHFKTLGPDDFRASGNAVNDIITAMLRALEDSYYRNYGLYNNSDAVNNVINMAKNIGGVIGGIATGIQKMAAGSIADNWDPKTGKPIHFRPINVEDVAKAGVWTEYILTATAKTISAVYYQNGKDGKPNPLFDGDDEDAPIMVAVKGVQKFGSIIANVAEGVQAIANLKVPIKWNKEGKPTNFKELNIEEITGKDGDPKTGKLYKVLNPVLSATASVIGSVYYKDWKVDKDGKISHGDVNDLFKTPRGGFLNSGDAPIVAAVESLTEMFDLVKNIIEVVQNVAMLKMPVGPFDKDGKPSKYVVMTKDKIENDLKDNIKTIMTALPQAIKEAYDIGDKNGYFGDNANENYEKMQESFGDMGGVLTNISSILTAYGNLKAPVLDKKGNIKSYVDINKVVKDMPTIQTNIDTLLTSLPDAFKNATSNYRLKNFETINTNVALLEESYDNIATIISSMGEPINEIITIDPIFKKLHKTKDNKFTELENIKAGADAFMVLARNIVNSEVIELRGTLFESGMENFERIIDNVANVAIYVAESIADMQEIINNETNKINTGTIIRTFNIYTSMFNNINDFVYFLNGGNKFTRLFGIKVDDSSTRWHGLDNIKVRFNENKFRDNVLVHVLRLGYILAAFSKKFNAIDYKSLVNTYLNFTFRKFYILRIIGEMSTFSAELNEKLYYVKYIRKDYIKKIENIYSLFKAVGDTFSKLNEISELVDRYDFKKEYWIARLSDINVLQEGIYRAFTVSDNVNFNNMAILGMLEIEAKFFQMKAKTLLRTAQDLSSISYWAAQVNPEGIGNVTNSIDQLDESLSAIEWETISKFEVENDNLKEYVKTINKVDVSKVNTMANLFDRLESFMYSVGDLPKFTEALADKLSTGLTGVAAETRIAAKVIKDAERIQKARQENIKKAVKDVETLMGKTLQIEVSRSDDGNSLSGNYTGDAPASTSESSVKSNDGSGRTKQRT